jgi:hypothetical protein
MIQLLGQAGILTWFSRALSGFQPLAWGIFRANRRDAGFPVDLQMVLEGFAWRFVKYSSNGRLIQAEAEERTARRGLWLDPAPVAPWEWRAQ